MSSFAAGEPRPSLAFQPEGAFRDRGRQIRHGFRDRRQALGLPLRSPLGRRGPPPPRARTVHARHAHDRERAHRSHPPGARPRRGHGGHEPAPEVRRGQLPDHEWLVAHSDLGGAADEYRRGPYPRRGLPAPALHGAHELLPLGGRFSGQGYRGHAPPAPVREGRDGLGHRSRKTAATSSSG